MDSDYGRRFYLITYHRTASNLLLRILYLENQPNIMLRKMGSYFFMPSFLLGIEKGIVASISKTGHETKEMK